MSTRDAVIEKDSLWVEVAYYDRYGVRDTIQVFDVTPAYMAHRAVAYTIIDGRNAYNDLRSRRMFSLESFLQRFQPLDDPTPDEFRGLIREAHERKHDHS